MATLRSRRRFLRAAWPCKMIAMISLGWGFRNGWRGSGDFLLNECIWAWLGWKGSCFFCNRLPLYHFPLNLFFSLRFFSHSTLEHFRCKVRRTAWRGFLLWFSIFFPQASFLPSPNYNNNTSLFFEKRQGHKFAAQKHHCLRPYRRRRNLFARRADGQQPLIKNVDTSTFELYELEKGKSTRSGDS